MNRDKNIPPENQETEAYMSPKKCPECSMPVVDELPGGLCPTCLMAAAQRSNPTFGDTAAMPQRMAPPAPDKLATMFGELEIVELIGAGGMGAVYKAKQKNLDRFVALKIFLFRDLDAKVTDRFEREAKALARLKHQNIVTVYDFGKRDQYHYLLMEYVDGPNLRQVVGDSQLSPAESIRLVPQLCDALQYAHDTGVVHRDIKPENVLLERDGKIKIADFGLAKLTGQSAELGLTNTRQVMGTYNYMAPEQRTAPTQVDHRADIYSLGVVIYELLTGELPLGRFQPPSKRVEVDAKMDEVVMRALEREPSQRYQKISEFKTEIESVAHLAPEKFTPMPPIKTTQPFLAQSGTEEPARQSQTIPEFIYFSLCMFVCCVGVLVLLFATEEFFPDFFERSSFGKLPGIFILLFGAYMFACSSFFKTIVSRKSIIAERLLAMFGCIAVLAGIAGGGSFVASQHTENLHPTPFNADTEAEQAAAEKALIEKRARDGGPINSIPAVWVARYRSVEDYERERQSLALTLRSVAIGLIVLCGFLFAVYGGAYSIIEEKKIQLNS
ncbi:MAG: serine/threonine protein kinase [Mariniblastus sp.]